MFFSCVHHTWRTNSQHPHRFRPGHNPSIAVAKALVAWADATSVRRVTVVATFDIVDHDLLCRKLSALEVGALKLRWFKYYLWADVAEGEIPRGYFVLTLQCVVWHSTGDPSGIGAFPSLPLQPPTFYEPWPSSIAHQRKRWLCRWCHHVGLWHLTWGRQADPGVKGQGSGLSHDDERKLLSTEPGQTQILWVGSVPECIGGTAIDSVDNLKSWVSNSIRKWKQAPTLSPSQQPKPP